MQLRKCNHCGEVIDASSNFCPHCGNKLDPIPQQVRMAQGNYNKHWVKEWRMKRIIEELVISAIFAILIIISVILMVTSIFSVGIPLLITSVSLYLIFLLIFLFSKINTRTIEGSTILIYSFIFNCLVVDGEVQSKSLTNRFLYGSLPNGKQIWAKMSALDGSIKIGIGENENQII